MREVGAEVGQPGAQAYKLEEGEGAGSRMASAEKRQQRRRRRGAGQPMEGTGRREHPVTEPCWGGGRYMGTECQGGRAGIEG